MLQSPVGSWLQRERVEHASIGQQPAALQTQLGRRVKIKSSICLSVRVKATVMVGLVVYTYLVSQHSEG